MGLGARLHVMIHSRLPLLVTPFESTVTRAFSPATNTHLEDEWLIAIGAGVSLSSSRMRYEFNTIVFSRSLEKWNEAQYSISRSRNHRR